MAKPKKEGNCHFCKKKCTDEFYCYGCQKFVCEACDKAGINIPFRPHLVEDHKRV